MFLLILFCGICGKMMFGNYLVLPSSRKSMSIIEYLHIPKMRYELRPTYSNLVDIYIVNNEIKFLIVLIDFLTLKP